MRGIELAKGDHVITMAILRHFDATADERAAYLKMSRAVRGEGEPEAGERRGGDERRRASCRRRATPKWAPPNSSSSPFRENGYGKRTSSHEYRVTGRGGKGIVAMAVNDRNGPLVASFPVEDERPVMLVSDGGQIIRMPIDDVRIIGRGTQGVTVFDVSADEKVVSVERLSEDEGGEADGEGEAQAGETPA